MTSRDRDSLGRARNARPRDALGRPLPRGAQGVPALTEDPIRTASQTLTEAAELLAAGLPFQAHEVLELRWKRSPEAERPLWQALAQLAVGITHAQRGNPAGARSLLHRARVGLADYPGPWPANLDRDALLHWLEGAGLHVRKPLSGPDPWFAEHPPPLTPATS